jgi:hypothetical protein
MSRSFLKFALWILCWAAMPHAGAQLLPQWLASDGPPKPPDFGVRDDNGFFNRDSATPKRISERIRQLRSDHGYQLYLVVEPVLIATNAPLLAANLQELWLPDGDGLVIVYEADNRSLGFGLDVGASPAATRTGPLVPTHETAAILRNVSAATAKDLPPEAFVETLIGNLVDELNRYFERRAAPPPAGRSLRMALLAIGALTLLGLAAILVGSLTRLDSMAERRRFRFPRVDRPERLGAPSGGGSVTSRQFGKASHRATQPAADSVIAKSPAPR